LPVTRARIAVEPATREEPGVAVGVDLGVADASSGGDARSDADLADRLRETGARLNGQQPAERIVVAVPDSWLGSGIDGARRREVVRRVLADELELPLLAIIARSQALVASQVGRDDAPDRDRPRAVTACHLDDGVLAFGRCEVTVAGAGPTIILTDCQDDHAAARPPDFGAVLAAALRTRLADGPAPAGTSVDAADSMASLFAELGARRERLKAALSASASNAVFLSVPVLGWPGTPPAQWVTAGEIKAGFEPLADALTSAISTFKAKVGPPHGVRLVLTGSAAANPLVVELVRTEFAGRADAAESVTVTVADDLAPARGAARVARGMVTAELPATAPCQLPVHRIAEGRLVSDSIDLPASCYLRPAGTATVLVTEGSTPPELLGDTAIPPGSYRAGLWPSLAGPVLALRPPGAAPAILVALGCGGNSSHHAGPGDGVSVTTDSERN
jgi:hypothetical protein